ncbi:YbbC/YhhH family protein [Limibacter armeniacum]|uniref:YbbC/YhhH family protein n=1 Tax=Limibacter armeniacum TaxID=466084 RepID=UPI002FE5D08C
MRDIILILAFFSISFIAYSQSDDRPRMGIEFAKQELETALNNSSEKQILVDTIIKSQETAIKYAEAILFEIYSQKNIEKQKPYEIYKIDGYWIIRGTLPSGMRGGTFLIIINSKSGQVIKLTHGK